MSQLQTNYIKILDSLKDKIRQARLKVAATVNIELIQLYWEIGKAIIEQQEKEGWGAKTIDKLAIDLKTEFPDFKGLSVRNLKYMRAFAEAYPTFFAIVQPMVAQLEKDKNTTASIVQPLVAQIPWTHHTIILDKAKTLEERLFYIEKTVQNGWSKVVLSLQIESELYKRQGNAITNFKTTLPAIQSDLAHETLKNPYLFDFLSFSEEIKERELEKGLIQHLKKFMLELGRGFAYVGNQKNINVEGDDYFLDLLFYNYHLRCFVVFELKVGDFKPEYAGKLNFYVNTINEQLKGEHDNPTIGVLLCKTPNETVVKYSLQNIKSPIGVSDYKLANALPKQIKTEMPTVEELEKELEKEIEELKKPSQKRLDALKEKLSKLKGEGIKQKVTIPDLLEIVDKSLLPLYITLIKRMEDFSDMFISCEYMWQGKNTSYKDVENNPSLFAEKWKKQEFENGTTNFHFIFMLNGFKRAGTEAFNSGFQLDFLIDTYWYGFKIINYNDQQPIIKKLYHEQLTTQDIETIVETIYNLIIDGIERRIEQINDLK